MTKGAVKIRVPELLEEKGWSIYRLAKEAGISYPTAYRLAQGEGESISFDMIGKLCKVFGVSVEDLIVQEG